MCISTRKELKPTNTVEQGYKLFRIGYRHNHMLETSKLTLAPIYGDMPKDEYPINRWMKAKDHGQEHPYEPGFHIYKHKTAIKGEDSFSRVGLQVEYKQAFVRGIFGGSKTVAARLMRIPLNDFNRKALIAMHKRHGMEVPKSLIQ